MSKRCARARPAHDQLRVRVDRVRRTVLLRGIALFRWTGSRLAVYRSTWILWTAVLSCSAEDKYPRADWHGPMPATELVTNLRVSTAPATTTPPFWSGEVSTVHVETNAGPDNQQETSTSSRRQEATKYLPYAASALAVFIYLPGSSVFERIILGAIGGIFLNGILLIGYLPMLHFVRWVGGSVTSSV